MADIIIVLIVIILLGLALKGSIKHFKGEGPCCGGGSGNSKKWGIGKNIFVTDASEDERLSLIHISEPTRP